MSGAKGEGTGEGRVRDETTLVFPPLTKVVSYLSPLNSYPHLKKTQREKKKEEDCRFLLCRREKEGENLLA